MFLSSATSVTEREPPLSTPKKKDNVSQAEIAKKEQYLRTLQGKIVTAKEELASTVKEKQYFKKKNVLRRESHMKGLIKKLRAENSRLKRKQRQEIQSEVQEDSNSSGKVLREQRMKSYFKRKSDTKSVQINLLKKINRGLRKQISCLEKKILNISKADFGEVGEGTFSDEVRLCVYDLLGLEVGIEKVSPVISTVAQRLFHTELKPSDLPSRQTVLRIADEAHYLAKRYYATLLLEKTNFGIKKDGTSRQKVKILDTSITLPCGEVLPQGFKMVARETAEAITETTKKQISEICEAAAEEDENTMQTRLLSKLSYLMTDRAANEKLSNRQLQEWVRSELTAAGVEPRPVHPMYCMVHVLLGFHREILKAVDEAQKEFEVEGGKVGRDAGSTFSAWRFENIAARLVRTVSSIFGPNGDEKCSVRAKWLADCRTRHVKSLIGDYRDNRFNGLFEGAAQVLHHIDDILSLEKKLPEQTNLKVRSVMMDLKDSRAVTILQAHALFYVYVTEPYRQLMVSKDIAYLHLARHIKSMFASLQDVVAQPHIMLEEDFVLGTLQPLDLHHRLHMSATSIRHPDRQGLLLDVLAKMAASCMKVIEMQLGEFLVGGALEGEPAEEEVRRTLGSGADNLASERHFGSLDSSMKRRRHATLHHHSTILILKSQRNNIIAWLDKMSEQERASVMRRARKEGKKLREKHRREIKEEQEKEQELLLEEEAKKGRSKRKSKDERSTSSKRPRLLETPDVSQLTIGQWVGVAYENGWYIGTVSEVSGEDVEVDFMQTTMTVGQFSWPSRKDIAVVDVKYIFRRLPSPPTPVSGGRLYQVPKEEHQALTQAFQEYKMMYFQ